MGERGEDFYKKVKKIPNVRLVRFNYYDDPKPWIEKSKAVITITGTSAYEAALLGKQSFVLGDVPFSLIKGVTQVKNIEELPALFKHCSYQKNIDECAAYIKAVKNVGEPFDLEYVMMSVYENLVLGKKLESRFFEELNHINNFFSKAVHIIDEGIEEKA